MSTPLPFGFGGNPFAGFDAPPGPDGFDLGAFEKADGTTTVPAGDYFCRIERGELKLTKSGKPAYRLWLKIVEPAVHAGFSVWRYYTLADALAANRAKQALAPLGLTTSADLRAVYPPIGKDVYVKALVTLRADPQRGPSNDVERFEPCEPPASAVTVPNPFAVAIEGGDGGDTP